MDHQDTRTGTDRREASRLIPVLVASFGAVALILIHYPGHLNPDSVQQLREAQSGGLSDWHPPIMAALWRLLLNAGEGPAPMLVFHVGLYCLGAWAFLDGCRNTSRGRFLVLAAALHPLLLVSLGYVVKDVGMAAALYAAFGLLFRQRSLGRPIGAPVGAAVTLLIIYASLVRANAALAAPALLLYWLGPAWLRPARVIAATAFLAALAIPASSFVNHRLLQAKRTGVEASLQLYDLAGIAHFSGDRTVLDVPASCYTPFHWDRLYSTGCSELAARLVNDDAPDPIAAQWIRAIASHPIAYARHRLEHFNSSTYFLVAPAHRCRAAPSYSGCDAPHAQILWADFIKKNFLYWPCVWLIAGAWLLFQSNATAASKALAWSGLFYGAGYLLVGVATDWRYYLWTVLAVATALALHFAAQDDWRAPLKRLAVPVALVAAAGHAARIVEALKVL